jgi:cytochrome c biogenesis protein CcdA
MIKKLILNYKKKSLNERFLLFIGILFFLIYLTFGIVLIFWTSFPVRLQPKYRIALGILLIVYGFFRFFRNFNTNNNEE